MTGRSIGYQENYFSLDDILATQEKMPCRLETTAYNLGNFTFASFFTSLRL